MARMLAGEDADAADDASEPATPQDEQAAPGSGVARWQRVIRRAGNPELLAAISLLALTVAVTIYRLLAADDVAYPGHADSAFYYGVAQNMHAGRGAKIDYIWEFLSGQPRLPRYAFDYWMPLPSVLMSWGLGLHNTIAGAVHVNVVMSVLVAVGTYLLARVLTRSRLAPLAAAAIVIVQPTVSYFSMHLEAPLYLAAFTLLAMAAAVKARDRPWLWPVTGLLAGLANLARNEGLVLIVVLLVAVIAWSPPGRRLRFTGGLILGYVAMMSPLFVASLQHFGSILPPASNNFPYITHYEDLYALHIDHSLSRFFGHSPHQFIALRLNTLEQMGTWVLSGTEAIDAFILLVLLGGCLPAALHASRAAARTGRVPPWLRSPWFVPCAFVVATVLYDALISPIVAGAGATQKVMATFLPILAIGAVAQFGRLRLSKVVAAGVVVILVAIPLFSLAQLTRQTIAQDNWVGAGQAKLIPKLEVEAACLGKPVVLMTRDPWDVNQATGVRTVQIPNAALPDILKVAQRYGVTDIKLDAKRSALSSPAQLLGQDGPLSPSAAFLPSDRIYRIKENIGDPRC